MLYLSKIENIYLAPGATDLRKSIDGCSNVVQYQMFLDPFSPSIFIFCNRTKTTIKVLEWDGNGFWLHTKKLIGKDRFRWPKSKEEASMLIDKRQLSWLLDGLEIEQKHAHHKIGRHPGHGGAVPDPHEGEALMLVTVVVGLLCLTGAGFVLVSAVSMRSSSSAA